MPPLGKNQADCLRSLLEHEGAWYPGCGWNWLNSTTTLRCMESLARRGLVEQILMPKVVGWKVSDPDEAWAEVARSAQRRA